MGLQINSNIPSLGTQRQVGRAADRLTRGLQGLASGLRINRAADDAAGLAIADRLRAEIRGLNQEIGNFQSGVNLLQTAEGGLEAQGGVIQRIRELALQASNGTLTDEQRSSINVEAQELRATLDDIGQNTEFNGLSPLDGSVSNVSLDGAGDIQVNLRESTVSSLGLDDLDLSTAGGAAAALDSLDQAQLRVDQDRAGLGAQVNRLETTIETRRTEALNQEEAESRIRDLDVAQAVIDRSRNEVLLQSGLSALAQSNITNENALFLLGG